ncbi:MAG TPA: energy transducer TonB [Candidatus Aquilonibacter sp.]|nr:energy transducer TonB [Candidatus Aquilonibacter sp.]
MHAAKTRSLVLTFLAVTLIAGAAHAQTKARVFIPPQALSVTDIPYPNQVNAAGLVSLEVLLNGHGHITGVAVLRDIPGLTKIAKSVVRKWTFASATLDGKPVAAAITVEVVFNTGILRTSNLQLAPPALFVPVAGLAYAPPVVQSADFAAYPVNSVAWGTVVLSASVGAMGQVARAGVLRDVPSLTQPSVSAVKTWTFSPATFEDNPIASDVIVAFCFRAANSAAP